MKVISYLPGRPVHVGMKELVKRSPTNFCLPEPGYDAVYTDDPVIADAYEDIGIKVYGPQKEPSTPKVKKSKEKSNAVYTQSDGLDGDGI